MASSASLRSVELTRLTARELRSMLRSRELSVADCLRAHLGVIDALNPSVNAVVTERREAAQRDASEMDDALARRVAELGGDSERAARELPPLWGLPVLHKDLAETKGLRTTYGSTLFADNVPAVDAVVVERVLAAGAVQLGKTNTPEFGAGSHTFNEVFGITRNPFDLSRSAGGSSGGAAAALACGFAPLADGSDLGGSLRNPASFCNVVGLRPSPGRVPLWPSPPGQAWLPLGVHGPMARTVGDVALLLDAMAGHDPRDPLSGSDSTWPDSGFLSNLAVLDSGEDGDPMHAAQQVAGARVAWSADIDGLPFDAEVTDVVGRALPALTEIGCAVEEASPGWRHATHTFNVLRSWAFDMSLGSLLDVSRAADASVQSRGGRLKDTIEWNIEQGRKLTAKQLSAAFRRHTDLYHRVREFMDHDGGFEFLAMPVVQVAPFPAEQEWPEVVGGKQMRSYVDWMASCFVVSLTGLPAISVPCGFTATGLPVGVQLVGRHRSEGRLLQLAQAFELRTRHWQRVPAVVADHTTAGQSH